MGSSDTTKIFKNLVSCVTKKEVQFSYIIIGNQQDQLPETVKKLGLFFNYNCLGSFCYSTDIIAKIVQLKPQLIFIFKNDKETDISLKLISEALSYLSFIPYFILISNTQDFALEAIQNGISDYLTDTDAHTLGMSLSKFEKRFSDIVPQTICIKSYSDYHLIKYKDIVYLKADNNTTDFKLYNTKIITAYKTLKYFEQTLPYNFVRIHKSYIVNIHYVSRIHFSKNKCYLDFNEQLPFTDTYRENIEQILNANLMS